MAQAVMVGLMVFNLSVLEYRDRITPELQVFVGLQPGHREGDGAEAWAQTTTTSLPQWFDGKLEEFITYKPRSKA
jgi:hypothetical protein